MKQLTSRSPQRTQFFDIDLTLLIIVMILLLFSISFVYTASSTRAERLHDDSAFFLKRQLLRVAIALAIMFLIMRVDYHRILRYSPPAYWIALALLVFLLFAPASWVIRGSRRWLMLGPVQFQPSELAKFALIFYLAGNLTKTEIDIENFVDGLLPQLILIGAVVLAVVMEPDMGTALAIAAIAMIMLFVAGARLGHLFLIALGGVLSAASLLWRIAYQRGRVESFIEAMLGDAEPVWQVRQALIGLGDGGLFGVGLGQSKQKLLFLPDPFTDFVLAIVGEELGLIGTLAIILLFFMIIWRGFHIAHHAPDRCGKLTAIGVTTAIGLYALVNAGVVTHILPTTGIPLPFVSYGGSALIMNLFGIGVLLNISQFVKEPLRSRAQMVPLARVRWFHDRKR
ncbi:MAG: putative lipid II flippase FtsW [candidate division KSB1 bacterium]|nr:putative lipid II flippase FtsW [candidate division KSB1 bacterium]